MYRSAVYTAVVEPGHILVGCTEIELSGNSGKREAVGVEETGVVDAAATGDPSGTGILLLLLLLLDMDLVHGPCTTLRLASSSSDIPLLLYSLLLDCHSGVHRLRRQNWQRALLSLDDLFEEEHSCCTAQAAAVAAARDGHEDCHMRLYMADHSGEKPC